MKKVLVSTAIIVYTIISQTVTPYAKAEPQGSKEGIEPSHSCHTCLPEGFLERKYNETTNEDKLNRLKKKLVVYNVKLAQNTLNITEENLPILKKGIMEANLPINIRIKTMQNLSSYYFQIKEFKESLILGVSAIQEEWIHNHKVTDKNKRCLTELIANIAKSGSLRDSSPIRVFIQNFEGNESENIPPFFSLYKDYTDYADVLENPIPTVRPNLSEIGQSVLKNGKISDPIKYFIHKAYIDHLFESYLHKNIEPYLLREEREQRQNALNFLRYLSLSDNDLRNNPSAPHMIAALYYQGKGTKKNLRKAREYLEIAANQGHVVAASTLGAAYSNGEFGIENYKLAKIYLEIAAKKEHAGAASTLGAAYFTGKFGKKKYKLAKIYLEIAANNNLNDAYIELSELWRFGLGVRQDLEKAVEYCQKAPETPLALNALGDAYFHGRGVPQDMARAKEYYRQAANLDDASGYANLGLMFFNELKGEETITDPEFAFNCFQEGASKGNARSQGLLGLCYLSGRGVEKDCDLGLYCANQALLSYANQDLLRNTPMALSLIKTVENILDFEEETAVQKNETEIDIRNQKEEKLTKIIKKHERDLVKLGIEDTSPSAAPPTLEYCFSDKGVKADFKSLLKGNDKIHEIIVDTAESPHSLGGSGKPEVLKGGFCGLRGCISRRINQEDRFIYKVISPNKILVISANGHYQINRQQTLKAEDFLENPVYIVEGDKLKEKAVK